MIDKIVEMSKVDIAGEEIEGATIQVLDKDNKVVDEWVSGKEPHKIKNLVEGETYTLHEEIVADSYVKATDIEFKVITDKGTFYFAVQGTKLLRLSLSEELFNAYAEGFLESNDA